MNLEDNVRDALVAELRRQADRRDLSFREEGEGFARIEGRVNLEELAFAIVGALSGGP
jgi:hypothetical protein